MRRLRSQLCGFLPVTEPLTSRLGTRTWFLGSTCWGVSTQVTSNPRSTSALPAPWRNHENNVDFQGLTQTRTCFEFIHILVSGSSLVFENHVTFSKWSRICETPYEANTFLVVTFMVLLQGNTFSLKLWITAIAHSHIHWIVTIFQPGG